MSVLRQSLMKISLPSIQSTLMRSYCSNPLKPPCGICPEELNIRDDDSSRFYDGDSGAGREESKEMPCKQHADLVPNFCDMKKLKDYELKSTCTTFEWNSEGH